MQFHTEEKMFKLNNFIRLVLQILKQFITHLICFDKMVIGFPPKPVTTMAPTSATYEFMRNVAILPPTRS